MPAVMPNAKSRPMIARKIAILLIQCLKLKGSVTLLPRVCVSQAWFNDRVQLQRKLARVCCPALSKKQELISDTHALPSGPWFQ